MSLAEQIELACLLEATARKAGNVHPAAAFDDLDYADFVDAAQAIAEPLSHTRETGLGRAILGAMQATRRARVRSNANLGIVLLLAPLAAIPDGVSLDEGLRDVLGRTTVEDAECVYEAIRLSRPSGLGRAESQDVNTTPTVTLRDAMALAAGRDRIAEQYATDFAFVLNTALPWLCHDWPWLGLCPLAIFGRTGMREEVPIAPWESAIIKLQLRLMADAPDSLIVRKCGETTGEQVRRRAAEMMDLDWPHRLQSWGRFDELDCWLRADGHRLNPGTTADLIAATLFAVMRAGLIEFPPRERILQHAEQLLFSPLERPTAMTTERYRVRVTKDHLVFSAAHFITFNGNICERLHGHNWRVAVEVAGPLDENSYVFDFIALRDAALKLVGELDHRVLLPTQHPAIHVQADDREVAATFETRRWVFPREDCVLLPVANTTAELIARWMALQLRDVIRQHPGQKLESLQLEIEENFGQWAMCEMPIA